MRSGRANFDDGIPAGELAENFGTRIAGWHKHAELPGDHFGEEPHCSQTRHHALGKIAQFDAMFRHHPRAAELEPVLKNDGGVVVDEGGPRICWLRGTLWFLDEGLVSDADPNVSGGENSGNPHYLPTARVHRAIRPDEILLLDLWGKLDVPGAVYADITWIGYTARRVPDRIAQAFEAVCAARDAAVRFVQQATREGREPRGFEVDRAASAVLREAGYGDAILHRTGHSLGESVHGNGVNMDDYETHDDRRLLAGTGFTIEPGVYFSDFGVRTEINMIVSPGDATVTGPLQAGIVELG